MAILTNNHIPHRISLDNWLITFRASHWFGAYTSLGGGVTDTCFNSWCQIHRRNRLDYKKELSIFHVFLAAARNPVSSKASGIV